MNPLTLRPGIARAFDVLSSEARARAEEHVTAYERHVAETVEGMTPWFLEGSDVMWFRLADLAERAGVVRHAMQQILQRSEKAGIVGPEEVRKGVKNEALNVSCHTVGQLTTNPKGVTLVSLRGAEALLSRCEGPTGIAAFKRIRRLAELSAELERLVVGLLVDQATPKLEPALPVSDGLQVLRRFSDAMMRASGREKTDLFLALYKDIEAVDAIAAATSGAAANSEVYVEYCVAEMLIPARFASMWRNHIRIRRYVLHDAQAAQRRALLTGS